MNDGEDDQATAKSCKGKQKSMIEKAPHTYAEVNLHTHVYLYTCLPFMKPSVTSVERGTLLIKLRAGLAATSVKLDGITDVQVFISCSQRMNDDCERLALLQLHLYYVCAENSLQNA